MILYAIKKHSVVFIDPPWGGRSYKDYKKLRLTLSNTSLESICNCILDDEIMTCTPNLIVLKLPTNYDVKFLYDTVNSKSIHLHELNKMLIIVILNTNK